MNNEFMYYSKITKKPYETIEALQEAETAVKKAEEEKAKKEEIRLEKVKEIEADFKALEEGFNAFEKKVKEYTNEYGQLKFQVKGDGKLSFPKFPFMFPFGWF